MTAARRLDARRTGLSRSAVRALHAAGHRNACSTVVLWSLGVPAEPGPRRSGREIREALERAGCRVDTMWANPDSMDCPTIAQFMRDHPDGDYVMVTGVNGDCHSMSLRDGRLTDTDLTGGNRRRVNVAYRVHGAGGMDLDTAKRIAERIFNGNG